MCCSTSKLIRRGFTLTELVVVTAMTVLGAVLLLPALAKGNQQTTRSKCMNNARQLALASQLYAADNNDLWPANGTSAQGLNLTNPPANWVPRIWLEGREGSNLNTEQEAQGAISEKVSLIGKYISDKEILRCPGDKALIRRGNLTFPRPRSYVLNLFIGWTPDQITGTSYHGEPNSRSRTFKKTATTPNPEDLFLFGEIHPFSICQSVFGSHPRWDAAGSPTGENRSFHIPANFHGNISTFSMADGHSESHKWVNPRFNDPYVGGRPLPEGNISWHNHDAPLPGVTAGEVESDFKWFALHATVPR
jgi:type II secretory pathway pseudopilin PulG